VKSGGFPPAASARALSLKLLNICP
jgi:hypothetical protein